MELTLTKLPWYAQVGAFVVLAAVGCGMFYFYYEEPARTDMASRQSQLEALRGDITKGLTTAKKLPEFRQQVADLEGRLANLKAILPEEKDAAELLKRMQTVAALANMSASSFHEHFRAMTAMSPLQFQKRIRLHEARRMLLARDIDATHVSLDVGYESASQFNREYRRLFGDPPGATRRRC